MPITIQATAGVLSPAAGQQLFADLTATFLRLHDFAGNAFLTPNVIGEVSEIPTGRSFAGGQPADIVVVELKVPSFVLATPEQKEAFIREATELVHQASGGKQPRAHLGEHGLHGRWPLGNRRAGLHQRPTRRSGRRLGMIAFAPYLNFDGCCEEAFRFYQRVFGGEIIILWAFENSPMANEVPPDWRRKILHARLRIGESLLMGGDELPEDYARPQGFRVAIHPADPAEAARLFQALSEGGRVRMPLTPTFWAAAFGMLDDRFGVPWMVSVRENV